MSDVWQMQDRARVLDMANTPNSAASLERNSPGSPVFVILNRPTHSE